MAQRCYVQLPRAVCAAVARHRRREEPPPSTSGSNGFRRLSIWRSLTRTRGGVEMKMRIVVPEAGHRRGLAERLITVFGPDRVSPATEQHKVDVRVEGPWDGAVLRVLATVEQWLDEI